MPAPNAESGDAVGAEPVLGTVAIAVEPKEEARSTLYARLGGDAAVHACVDIFYGKVLADPSLARFFQGVDMAKQMKHQVAFMTMAFGGPKKYSGRAMEAVHARLIKDQGLGPQHFDSVAGHLVASLSQLNVPQSMIDEVVAIVGPLRSIFEPKPEVAAA